MEIVIRSFLGIERADLMVAPIALLAGNNGAGKSSTIAAAAAALTGLPLPAGIAKKDAKVVVRDGADGGRVIVRTAEGMSSVMWPASEPSSEGRPPRASQFAAGLLSLLEMDVKERAKVLAKYLKTEPNKPDLVAALSATTSKFEGAGVGRNEEVEPMKALGLNWSDQRDVGIFRIVEKVWPQIEVNGFDGAASQVEKQRAEAKGAWRQVTGDNYGSEKALQWRPKDSILVDEIVPTGQDPATFLDAEIAKRKKAVDTAVRGAAVAAADLDGLRAKAATVADLTTAEAEAKALKTKLSDAYQEWTRKQVPLIPEPPLSCPHCGCDVVIENGKLVAASHAPDAATIAAATAARAEHDAGREAAKKAFDDAYEAHKKAEVALNEAKAAAKKLAELGEVGGNVTEADVEKAKQALSQAERALTAIKQKAEADRLHRQVEASQLLVDLLAPDGMRKTRLANVLTSFAESRLLPLSKAAGYQPVTIGQDMEIRYGGRLAREPFVSESQAMRARIVLQVAMAQLDRSECVLIDKGDKLDKRGRDGLFALLKAAEVKAIVAMKMDKADKMPDLLRAKLGEAYWIAQGVTATRAQVLEPQQQAAE